MKSLRLLFLILPLCLPGLAGLAGCKKKPAAAAPPPPEVTVVRPIQRDIVEWDEYTGRLQSSEAVEVRPRVSGYLESIHFTDGQMIQKGDLLFIIDPRPYQAVFDGAQASVKQAEAQQKLAETNFVRSEDLRRKAVVAQNEFDTNVNALQTSRAAAGTAEASLASAQLNLTFTHVTAPGSGRIGRHLVSVGNLISSDSTLLTTIVSLDPIYCYFEVDERSFLHYMDLARRLREANAGGSEASVPIEMGLATDVGYPISGKVNFVDNQVDAATATIEMRGIISNPDLRLTPGLFTRVRIPAREKHPAVLIPDEAVGSDQSVQFVFAVGADNKAVRRPVELGPLADGLRVVRSGITPQDRIIAVGLIKVLPNTPVKPLEKSIEELQAAENPSRSPAPAPAPKEAK